MIEPWLLETIVQIVATYTRPGQRVLLLAAPTSPGTDRATPPGHRTESGLLPALIDAAETASRLDRTLEARTIVTNTPARVIGDAPPPWPQSVHRLPHEPLPPAPTGHRPTPQRCGPTGVGPHPFDAVIAPLDPHHPDWVGDVSWGSLLPPSGVLAFITHSDHQQGRLIDPESVLTRAAHRTGLLLLDHVALLQAPVRDGSLALEPRPPAVPTPDDASCSPAPWHTRVHADLLLFTHPRHAANPGGADRR